MSVFLSFFLSVSDYFEEKIYLLSGLASLSSVLRCAVKILTELWSSLKKVFLLYHQMFIVLTSAL